MERDAFAADRDVNGTGPGDAGTAPHEPATTARLTIEEPDRAPTTLDLSPGAEVRIGRADASGVRFEDRRVSRVHAVLTFDGRVFTVRDEQSRNGTYVGVERVRGARQVGDGGVIDIGSPDCVVRLALNPGGPQDSENGPASAAVAIAPSSIALFAEVHRLARTSLALIVVGEAGTGKEFVARMLHRHSARARGPFITLDCAALPESIARAVLFGQGHDGPDARRIGVIEEASGGTLFLGDVGALSPSIQARLARAIAGRTVSPIGSGMARPVDVRLVASTDLDLADEVTRGRFRRDLHDLLDGATVWIAPLRGRTTDILPMVARRLSRHGSSRRLGPGVAEALLRHPWPGNVRELNLVVDRGMTSAIGGEIRTEHLDFRPADPRDAPLGVGVSGRPLGRSEETERRAILAAIHATSGNRSRAARDLGVSRRCLITRMARYGLTMKSVNHDED